MRKKAAAMSTRTPPFALEQKPSARQRRLQLGQATVEFSLTLILFLAVTIGILEFGRVVWLYHTLSNLTREIARHTAAAQYQREPLGDIHTPGTILGDVVLQYSTGLNTAYLVPGTPGTNNSLPTPSLATVGIYITPGDSCRTLPDTLQTGSPFGPGGLNWLSYAREYQNCQDGTSGTALRVNPPGTATFTVAIYYPLQSDTLIPDFGFIDNLLASAETTVLFE
jgi:hypothetical protein